MKGGIHATHDKSARRAGAASVHTSSKESKKVSLTLGVRKAILCPLMSLPWNISSLFCHTWESHNTMPKTVTDDRGKAASPSTWLPVSAPVTAVFCKELLVLFSGQKSFLRPGFLFESPPCDIWSSGHEVWSPDVIYLNGKKRVL